MPATKENIYHSTDTELQESVGGKGLWKGVTSASKTLVRFSPEIFYLS